MTTSGWQALVDFAREHGWAADLTTTGRVRLSKDGSVVLAPPPSALTREAVADAVERMGYADGYMAHWRRRRP